MLSIQILLFFVLSVILIIVGLLKKNKTLKILAAIFFGWFILGVLYLIVFRIMD